MSVSWQIPRNCLAWILISQLVLIVPHSQRYLGGYWPFMFYVRFGE